MPGCARACSCARACLSALPYAALSCAAGASVGVAIFSIATRQALHTTSDAADLLASSMGVREYIRVALDCVTAVVVVVSVSLTLSFLTSLVAHAARRRWATRHWLPGRAFVTCVCLVATLAFLAALLNIGALASVTTGMVAAKLAELAAGRVGEFTDDLASGTSGVVSRAGAVSAFTDALNITRAVPPPSPDGSGTGCGASCFNAARFPFLDSRACLCGAALREFRRSMHRTFTKGIVSVVGGAIATGSMVLLYAVVTAHAAKLLQQRRHSLAMAREAAQSLKAAPLHGVLRQSSWRGNGGAAERRVSFDLEANAAQPRHTRAFSL